MGSGILAAEFDERATCKPELHLVLLVAEYGQRRAGSSNNDRALLSYFHLSPRPREKLKYLFTQICLLHRLQPISSRIDEFHIIAPLQARMPNMFL